MKSGDDCRQEHLAVQLISHFYGRCLQIVLHSSWLTIQRLLSESSMFLLRDAI